MNTNKDIIANLKSFHFQSNAFCLRNTPFEIIVGKLKKGAFRHSFSYPQLYQNSEGTGIVPYSGDLFQ